MFLAVLRGLALSFVIAMSAAAAEVPKDFITAVDLIQGYSGSGDELERAGQLATKLAAAYPKSGYAQALQAEAASTWMLDQDGEPARFRQQILDLCDEALRLNPGLAYAHVAKARVYVRSRMYQEASAATAAALAIDPKLAGALFLQADILRRTGDLAGAEKGYRRFIDATPDAGRKANGYAWIATMYQDAAWRARQDRPALVAKARAAHEAGLALAPAGAWRYVNFAQFLNEYTDDFATAQVYAIKALQMMEFPMGRYQLAAARYLQLWQQQPAQPGLAKAVGEVAAATKVPLAKAMQAEVFSARLRDRLEELATRLEPAR